MPISSQKTKKSESNPMLKEYWLKIRKEFFPERTDLDDYCVTWSGRNQKRTLASCNYVKRKVIVAKELNTPALFVWLPALLYHEMCHAYLGSSVQRAHGREFKNLEQQHPDTLALKTWIAQGGWRTAVRSDRARNSKTRRTKTLKKKVVTRKKTFKIVEFYHKLLMNFQ